MTVSTSDVNAMADLMGALDDVDSGKATQQVNEAVRTGDYSNLNDSQVDQAAMKGILSSLYSVAGDELQAPQPTIDPHAQAHVQPTNMYEMAQDDMSYDEYLALTQGKQLHNVDTITGQPTTQQYQQLSGPEWTIVSEHYSGVKSLNRHSIKHSVSGTVILADITLKESAHAICNMLNEGKTINNPKVLGIISSGIQYTTIVEQMVQTLKTKRKVIRESNYDAAKQCDATIHARKQQASDIKTELLAYLTKHGISYK